jgi:AraC-like DNA-binding protein
MAFLPEQLLDTVRIVTARRHCLVAIDSMSDLVRALGTTGRGVEDSAADILVVDPQGPGCPGATGLVPILAAAGSVAVIVYTSLSSAAAHDVVALGMRHVVLHRVDDGIAAFRDLLERAPADTLSTGLLAELGPALADVPPELGRAIRELVYTPELVPTVAAFRQAAGMPRMTFERALGRAGFASPRRMLWAARALRVYYYVRLRQQRANAVSVRLGYPTARQMAEEFRRVAGYPPSQLPEAMTPAAFVSIVASRIRG